MVQLANNLALKDIDKGWNKLRSAIGKLEVRKGGPVLDIGISDGFGADVLLYAMVHEFGSPSAGIPQRSYVRSTIDDNREKYAKLVKGIGIAARSAMALAASQQQDAFAAWDLTARRGLEKLGQMVTYDIQVKIESNIPPELKPATVSRKQKQGMAKPTIALIGKGLLIKSIAHEVTSGTDGKSAVTSG